MAARTGSPFTAGAPPSADAGALAAKELFIAVQQGLRSHAGGYLDPTLLMHDAALILDGGDAEYREGFYSAVWAYLELTLEGCNVNPATRQVLDHLSECRPQDLHPSRDSNCS